MKITQADYLKGREKISPLNEVQKQNMKKLLAVVNKLINEKDFPGFFGVTSGYRPASINSAVGGALKSAHLTCEAIDLGDPAGIIDRWLVNNPQILEKYDLYLEIPSKTPGWSHIQIRKTKSGKRVFIP